MPALDARLTQALSGSYAIVRELGAGGMATVHLAEDVGSLVTTGAHPVYHWTLTGTNTGPGGTGKAVRIHGYEQWPIGADGLIAASLGHFDEAEYARQLKEGAGV